MLPVGAVFDALEARFVIIDDGLKVTVAFSNDPHRCLDLLDHDVEMAASRLAFFANAGFNRLESLVDTHESLVDTHESLIDTHESFVHARKPLIMTGKPVLNALEAFDNGPVQFLNRHGASILASSRPMRFACRNDNPPLSR
jgi:hypothetical protein